VKTLDAIVHQIVQWQRETFPHQDVASTIDHLREEIDELADDPSGEELADCAMLIFAIADRSGVDLPAELERKHAVNRARTWIEQPDRSFRHERAESAE
jgi:NTP pyrophosphatase (non-canonical NTP hydrolase)